MKIGIIGCGRWGSFLSWYLDRTGHDVALYGRKSSQNMQTLLATRKNEFLELNCNIKLTTEMSDFEDKDVITILADKSQLYCVPKRCFEDTEKSAEFADFLAQKLQKRYFKNK